MKIEIYSKIEMNQEIPKLIEKSAKAVLEHEGISYDCIVDVTITDNQEIQLLNKEYRDKDYPTDVLSFPMVEYENGSLQEDLTMCIDPDTGSVHLGDMIISYDKVLEQARQYEHSKEREFAFLTVHSVLHLLGYDHEGTEEDMLLMQKKEKQVLSMLGINRE